MTIQTTINGSLVNVTKAQLETIETLKACRNGGVACIYDYRPNDRQNGSKSASWVTAPTQTIQFISKGSVTNLYQRTIDAMKSITYGSIADFIASDSVLAEMSHTDLVTQFEKCQAASITTCEKTLSGDRSDAHRQGHDRCYLPVSNGVKVHLITTKGSDNKQHPIIDDRGIPTVDSIMINAFFLSVKNSVEGTRYIANSGAKVRMDKVIQRAFAQTGLQLKTLSLKDNFSKLVIDHQVIKSAQYLQMVG